MKILSVLDAFLPAGYTKSSKFERVMIVQTHAHDGKNAGFLKLFKLNYYFFVQENRKTIRYTR